MKDIVLKQKVRKGRRKVRRRSGQEKHFMRRNEKVQETRDRKKQTRKRLRMIQVQRSLDKQTEILRAFPANAPEVKTAS
jgi:hypothetical protein